MSYESPISLMYRTINTKLEGEIMTAVHQVDIEVDRDELIKALQYDRNQYDTGYANGQDDARKEIIKWLNRHSYTWAANYLAQHYGVRM